MTDQSSSTSVADEHEYVYLTGEVITQLRDLIAAADPNVTSSQLEAFNHQFQIVIHNIEKKALKAEGGHLDLMATKLAVHQVQRDCLSVITKYYTEENSKPNVIKVFSSLVKLDNINHDEIFKSTPETRSEIDSDEDDEPAAPPPPNRQEQIKSAIRSVKNFVFSSLPILEWVPKYRFPQFRGDITAALAVGFMIIPQGLAYAILAGLPPIYGLYTAWSPLFLYFLFGSSRELAVGPTAMVSLVIPTVVGDTQVSGSEEYAQQVIFYSFIYGFVLTILGILRIGFLLENILSRPALNGFTQGAAVLIACSQLKNLLGLPAIHVNYTVPELLSAVVEHIEYANLWSCLMGFISIAIIMFFKKVKKSFPSIIFILAIAILITYLTKLDQKGLKIVGTVPPGVPKPKAADVSGRDVTETFGAVLVLVFMGFVESVSVAKKFAAENQYHLHVSQELLALGMASMVGSAFQAYPVSGSLPRTVTGAKTPMASLFAGLIVTIMLSFATPLIYYTPLSVLGAIVASAALAIIDFNDIKFLWKINEKVDLIKYLLTYFATMLFGPIMGVVFAGLLSLLQVIYWSSRPKFILLGKVGVAWRDVDSYANTVQVPGALIVRMDAPRMSFYNISWFREGLENMELRLREEGSQAPVQTIIIDLSPTNGVDATAIQYLQEIVGSYQKRGIKLYWVSMKSNIKSVFEQTGVTQNKVHRNIFPKIEDALQDAKRDIRSSSNETPGMVQLDVVEDSSIQASSSSSSAPNPLTSSGKLENDIMDLGERTDATFKRAPLVPLKVDQYAKWDI